MPETKQTRHLKQVKPLKEPFNLVDTKGIHTKNKNTRKPNQKEGIKEIVTRNTISDTPSEKSEIQIYQFPEVIEPEPEKPQEEVKQTPKPPKKKRKKRYYVEYYVQPCY